MNNPKLFIAILAILFLQGCNKCGDKPLNEVRVRVQNDLELDLIRISIGSTMYRGVNSFASCTMTEAFKDVNQGQLTEYTTTYGNHMGYDKIRVQWDDETRDAVSSSTEKDEIFEAELVRNGAVEDSVANVYNGDMEYGLRLPDGDYTYILKGFTIAQNPQLDVEIRRDN